MPCPQPRARKPPRRCQNHPGDGRRFCKSFPNPTRAPSSQWSFVDRRAFLSSLLLSALFWGWPRADPPPCGILAGGFPKGDVAVAEEAPPGTRTPRGRGDAAGLAEQAGAREAGEICLKRSVVSTSLNQVHLSHLCLIDKLGVIKTNFQFIQFIQILFFVQMCTAL